MAERILVRLTEEPSDGWQGRWLSSGAEDGPGWVDDLFAPEDRGSKRQKHDNLMMGLRALLLCRIVFPGYGFLTNKGYYTPEHFQAIKDIGPCDLHRRSFSPVKEILLGYQLDLMPDFAEPAIGSTHDLAPAIV